MVGPRGHGGEEVYVRTLLENPPSGVSYIPAGGFHEGAPGVRCRVLEEVLLNRLVHPLAVPDMGFRAFHLREEFDLLHIHAHPVLLSGLGGTPVVMSEGSSSAVYLQGYLNWDDDRLRRGYARTRRLYRALGIHDRLLNLSRVSRAYVFSSWARSINIRWGAEPAKIDVVYPGFPTPALTPRPDRDEFTFLFVGTDFERKGGFEILEAFAVVSARHPSAKLRIVSHDPRYRNPDRLHHSWVAEAMREKLLSVLASLIAAGRAQWEPLCVRRELYERVYPGADAFVMPSHAEGFGFTNVEALSFAVPVISSTVGAIPEAVQDGITGLLVAPGDVDALIQAMERLLTDPPLASRLGAAGRADFLTRFTLDHFQRDVGRVYRRALEQPCPAS
jgi:glycosyltransferase involved in cell wall biosynthesis